MMKTIFLIINIFFIASANVVAQQEFHLSNERYSLLNFNPSSAAAFADQEVRSSAMFNFRNQWFGFEGAPTTYNGIVEHFMEDYNIGLGLSLFNDQIGVDSKWQVSGNYSYRIRLREGFINAGISTSYSRFGNDFTQVRNVDAGDIYDNGSDPVSVFSAGFGIMLHDESLRIGFGSPAFFAFSSEDSNRFKQRHYYAHASFKLGDDFDDIQLEPTLLFKFESSVPVQTKLGLIVWIYDQFSPSIQYRWEDALVLGFGWLVDERFQLGLGYDITLSQLRTVSNNTFELQLGYLMY